MRYSSWTAGQLALLWFSGLLIDGFIALLYFNHFIDERGEMVEAVFFLVPVLLVVVTWKWLGARKS